MHQIISIVLPHALAVAARASHMASIGIAALNANTLETVLMVDVVLIDNVWMQKEMIAVRQRRKPQCNRRWKICVSWSKFSCRRCLWKVAYGG